MLLALKNKFMTNLNPQDPNFVEQYCELSTSRFLQPGVSWTEAAALFFNLAEQLFSEANIYHDPYKSIDDFAQMLYASFAAGFATVLINSDNRIVGYVRNIPLLDASLKNSLSIPNQIANIYELGTLFVRDDHRHDGLSVKALIRRHIAQTRDHGLIIGTMKHPNVAASLKIAAKEGVMFAVTNTDFYKMIQPFTCVCEGKFGNGVHLGPECPNRGHLSGNNIVAVSDITKVNSVGLLGANPETGATDCLMFVSDVGLAASIEANLMQVYTNRVVNLNQAIQQVMIDQLVEEGYFGNFGAIES